MHAFKDRNLSTTSFWFSLAVCFRWVNDALLTASVHNPEVDEIKTVYNKKKQIACKVIHYKIEHVKLPCNHQR